MPNTNNQFSFLDYTGLSLFWSKVKKIIEDNELVTATALTDLDTRVDNLEGAISDQIISKTYTELKTLRDNGQLVPGQQYRITDYTCTTTQAGTKSAGHVFDIIVTADSESVLNEEARAIQHVGDDYFTNSDLNAWKLWYSLDNDTNRFAWADSTNGKGVIYRMIDEFNNDVPFDFKNIQFYRQWDSSKSLWSTISTDATGVPCYTFSSVGDSSTTSFTDYSLRISNNVYSNVIKEYIKSNKQTLNNNCFFGNGCYSNSFGNDCYFNTFGEYCNSNTFGRGCYNNTFGEYCNSNTFGSDCRNNSFGSDCHNNSFGEYCSSNSFGEYYYYNSFAKTCSSNSFGKYCSNNSFGDDCDKNSFGEYCSSNSFGEYCYSNSFGNNCDSNSFGNYCYDNSFGEDCISNSFGNSCSSNSFEYSCYRNFFGNECCNTSFGNNCSSNFFGNNCNYNSFGNNCSVNSFGNCCASNSFGNYCSDNFFGNGCYKIKFASDKNNTTKYTYYKNNHFGDGCEYILFRGTETASSYAQVQNYKFAQGLSGDYNAYLTIEGKRNRSYETYISKDTDGTIKESIIAEKLDKMIEISYADLVALRSNSKLIPGQQYRITDYTCTTTTSGTKSAGHVFDIIVTADSENVLNEEARAALHADDSYFSGCDLNAWKLWYSLDNNTKRFAWADKTNGKGVIYRMIDEFNNDVSYDFKNIQFYRQWDSNESLWSTISSDNTGVPCYTFSSEGDSSTISFTDISLSVSNNVYSNVIKEYIKDNEQTLNNNCFFGKWCNNNSFGSNCYRNSFGSSCNGNTFGNDCYSNTFRDSCYSNSFGNECYNNSCGRSCQDNSFGSRFSYNSFSWGSYNNSFGNECSHNSFGDGYNRNSVGNYCRDNSFGHNCWSNSFGNWCNNNSFGNNCNYNSFGNDCYNIKFASDSSAATKYKYYQNNHFGDGCCYIVFTGTETASDSQRVQNYKFAQGLKGTSNTYLAIDGKRNRDFETKVAKKSNGELVIYCEADLIMTN